MQPTHRRSPRIGRCRAARGATLIETTVVAALTAIIAGVAAPSFDRATQRRHLEGAAAQFETDVHYARTLAVARNASVRVGFGSSVTGSCYVIHTGPAGACTCHADGSAQCSDGAQAERVVHFDKGGTVGVKSNAASVLFDPMRGTATPTVTVQLQARNGLTIHQVLNIMGRVRSCTPAPGIEGYRRC